MKTYCCVSLIKSNIIFYRLILSFLLISDFPLRANSIDIHLNARWQQNGFTVAGGYRQGNPINQLSMPCGLYVDNEQTIYVTEFENHRTIEWKSGFGANN